MAIQITQALLRQNKLIDFLLPVPMLAANCADVGSEF